MQATTVSSFFFLPLFFPRSPILGGSLTLYTSFQSILTLHLLIMQVITQVLIPLATFPNPLWVAATKAALFRGHFLINAARTLVGCIQCGGDNFSLDSPTPYTHGYSTILVLLLGRSGRLPLPVCCSLLLGFGMPRTGSSSATFLGHLGFLCQSSAISPSSAQVLSPIQSGPRLSNSLTPQKS